MEQPTLRHAPTDITMERERLRAVFYGTYGVGKTTLAMTFPKPFVLDFDGGLVSVTVEAGNTVLGKRYTPTGHKDLEALLYWVRSHIGDSETIVVDDLDGMVDTLLCELVDAGAAYDSGKGKESHPVAQFVPEQAEYLANQRQMTAFLHALRQFGLHVVLLSGRRHDIDKGKPPSPNLAPGLLSKVMHWASLVGELVVTDDGQRVLCTAPSSKREAKSRFRCLTPVVVEPTFSSMWSAIEAAYASHTSTTSPPASGSGH